MSDLARELREALDDPKRYEWGEGPWEHLGDAERDVRRLLDDLDAAERQLQETREALAACIPWIASHPRSAAQEALAVACELVGSDPYDWTHYPDELTARRKILGLPDRRAVSSADTTEGA